MATNTLYNIHTFDDGNDKYRDFPNEWIIVETMFNGGKVKLQNKRINTLFINSISSWKIIKQ